MSDIVKNFRPRRIRLGRKNQNVVRTASAQLPTEFGDFEIHIYSDVAKKEHVALTMGDVSGGKPVLVRLHSECFTGDVLASLKCECGVQLKMAMKKIAKAGKGVILYMRQEGRGIGLTSKIQAYALQQKHGLDTIEANERLGFGADMRDYKLASVILHDLGVKKINLLTNNPSKAAGLKKEGIEVVKCMPIEVKPNKYNKAYLRVKKKKMGHVLKLV